MARQSINGQRKNLVLSRATDQRIKAIREISELPSDAEVIRKAVDFYTQVIKFQATGHTIDVRDPDGTGTTIPFHFKWSILSMAPELTLAALDIPKGAIATTAIPTFEVA